MSDPLDERVVAAVGDQYRIECEIGRGGMSVVYRARDLRLNRTVAIKVLPPELAYDPAIRLRFTREAQTSAQLAHAHIVPIYDVGERDGIAYFVMALVNGGNVATLLEREPRRPIEEVRRLLCEIADALAYAHMRGVIHRDIKPDNILLDGDNGRAVVTDFGIARAMEGGTRLTVTGLAVGTPTYMSPEQAMGEREVDGRSDIYSLGILGYQMLTGRVPFSAGNSMALLLKQVSETPRPIGELRAETPPALREAIERAMMKDPQDRWSTAAAFRNAVLSNEPAGTAWRAERREPVRYTSPRPDGTRAVSPRRGSPAPEVRPEAAGERLPNGIEMVQPHLASLTPAQQADLRLWHGHVNLLDRVKALRSYAVLTAGAVILAVGGLVMVVDSDAVPFIFGPIVPFVMSVKLWRRSLSLRASGLRLRRVFLMPRAKWVFPTPPRQTAVLELEKLAPREILESPHGAAIRRAVVDRGAILAIAASLPKADRSVVPDLIPTVNALVDRVAQLAQLLHRLEQSFDPRHAEQLSARIAEVASDGDTPEGERRLALLRRQLATLEELKQQRTGLVRQLDNAGLALGSLRLDLVKLRSSGLQSALADVSTATREARALSKEIDAVVEAAAEVRDL